MKKTTLSTLFGLALLTLASCQQGLGGETDSTGIETSENGGGQPREYYSDTVTIYIPNEKEPVFLEVNLNRRELEDHTGFQHYYYLRYQDEKGDYSDFAQEIYPERAPHTFKFLETWENELFEDLSTRETYAFSVLVDGEVFEVELSGLEGDFLTKNTPEYTRYTSVGGATVSHNGMTQQAHAVLEKAYSVDDSVYVYFDGIETLDNRTDSMHLWDEDGNYYYFDKTEVFSQPENYSSHSWLLHKDFEENITQKSFEVEVDFSETKTEWVIKMPEFGVEMTLNTDAEFSENPSHGPVEGQLKTREGEVKEVNGWFTHYARS